MKKITYLFIEDKDEQLTHDIIENIEFENSEIEIILTDPLPFQEALKQLPTLKYDGLLLDLRLDEESEAEYRAFTLAQEIRTRTTERAKGWDDVPIVICSTDPKLKRSYTKNIAGQDLFDKKYRKDEDMIEHSEYVANELVALAKGYKLINKIKAGKRNVKPADLFKLNKTDAQLLDERLLFFSLGPSGVLPTHEYARFLLREIIEKPGALVDLNLLLSRLGIAQNSPDKDKFLTTILQKYQYKGPFHEGYLRWWWPLVSNWWFKTFKSSTGLVNLTSAERVMLINEKLKLNLIPAKPIDKTYSAKFWTTCKFLGVPINPFDGFMIDQGFEPYPWQDKSYISRKASLDSRTKTSGLLIHPSDKAKFEIYKKGNR